MYTRTALPFSIHVSANRRRKRGDYGPLVILIVNVLLYVPAYALAGMVTVKLGVTVKLPIPVSAVALKNFDVVEPSAVSTSGYEMPLTVGLVQVPLLQLVDGCELMRATSVASV